MTLASVNFNAVWKCQFAAARLICNAIFTLNLSSIFHFQWIRFGNRIVSHIFPTPVDSSESWMRHANKQIASQGDFVPNEKILSIDFHD